MGRLDSEEVIISGCIVYVLCAELSKTMIMHSSQGPDANGRHAEESLLKVQ